MEQRKKLDDLNKELLENFDAYLKTKGEIKKEDHEKVKMAKEEWQVAWNKVVETLMVLERLEI